MKLHYSFPLLKITFALVILVFFAVVLRHLLLLPRPLAVDQVTRRTDLAQSLLRPGLNIDNLPLVKIDYGKYKPQSGVPNDDGTIDESINRAQIRQLCLTRGYYLGPENTDGNCSSVCGVDEQEVAYTYVSRTDAKRIVAGRQLLRAGGYCMPTLMASCNRNTSSVVYSINGWTCIPRTDAFAGEGGNRIVVCNGRLRDNALKVVYQDFVPPNLVFGNVYTDRLGDGTYRFECPRRERDSGGNLYLRSAYNRLHSVRDRCVEDVPFASGATTDLTRGKCVCGPDLTFDKLSGKCTACSVAFSRDTKQIAFTSKPCFSFADTIQQFEERWENLKNSDNSSDRDESKLTIFPCGFNSQGTSSEYTLPRCLNYNIALYQPALPSHNTLNVIDTLAG